ncbi:phosphotransferase family protein [Streptomyces sp. NPDC021100]|uniref:phosphotransferase family protein n=1 Tax=Streptomyces sp. NPDC021100 TaxID=3365114 RepID=UPI003793534D
MFASTGMVFQPVVRSAGSFQEAVSAEQVQQMCARALGPGTRVLSAVELDGGTTSTFRVTVASADRPVILRVAPCPARQARSERELMRREFAALPWLSRISPMMPRVLAVDWSHEVIGRDFMLQSLLDGVPARDRLREYPRSVWSEFFRQLGEITRELHGVHGPHFGPVGGPAYVTWGQTVIALLEDLIADLDGVGLDVSDLHRAVGAAVAERDVLDDITEPRLLSGGLWTGNIMLGAAPVPAITGVLGLDRVVWGDPAADRPIHLARRSEERQAFWEGYGALDRSPAAAWRSRIYEVWHLGAIRLERHRLGDAAGVRDTYVAAAALGDLA